jgi:UDP-N-acetylmuramoyl-tripeptide--D-alanyl-D-alanine ligase
MAAALRDLAGRPGRRVAVLGDMMELGADEGRYHREVGALVVELRLDGLVAVGERARWYLEAADGVPGTHFADAVGAAEGIGDLVAPGDVVLVKGSRSMALERVVGALLP